MLVTLNYFVFTIGCSADGAFKDKDGEDDGDGNEDEDEGDDLKIQSVKPKVRLYVESLFYESPI